MCACRSVSGCTYFFFLSLPSSAQIVLRTNSDSSKNTGQATTRVSYGSTSSSDTHPRAIHTTHPIPSTDHGRQARHMLDRYLIFNINSSRTQLLHKLNSTCTWCWYPPSSLSAACMLPLLSRAGRFVLHSMPLLRSPVTSSWTELVGASGRTLRDQCFT